VLFSLTLSLPGCDKNNKNKNLYELHHHGARQQQEKNNGGKRPPASDRK
jgi:hypothetical protein